ncbi:MAG: hypothetical protein AAFY59_08280 [Pseudomonadota bacterium]
MIRSLLAALFLAFPAQAQDVTMAALSPETARILRPVVVAAERAFPRLPGVTLTSSLRNVCGGDAASDPFANYCTDLNRIYVAKLAETGMSADEMIYRLAHLYGHAVQVRHGIADVALATIRANRAEEGLLRANVTQQVECIAGVIAGRATGGRVRGPASWATEEPFTGSHWGASPIARGPKVSIGLAARNDWFLKGRDSDDFAACATERFSADLILRAVRP